MTTTASSPFPAAGRLQWRILLALCGITLAVFAGVGELEFVHYDDSVNIYRNPHLKGLGWEEIKWMFTDTSYARRYMPLGWMSYAIDYQFFGLNPRAYHLGNLLLHLLNVGLLFFLLRRLLARGKPESSGAPSDLATPEAGPGGNTDSAAIWCAGIGALFWAVNPLRVESVAWASSRIYCVVFLFTLLWLLAWLRARDPATTPRFRFSLYFLSALAYAASLLTYPLMLFAPIALFALEMVPNRGRRPALSDWWSRASFRKLWLDKLPFLALSAGALVLTASARLNSSAVYRPVTLEEFGLLSRVMQSFYVWAYYAWKPWAPYDLSATYPTLHWFDPLDLKFLASAGLVATVTLMFLFGWKRWPAALALWVCHLAILVPALGLTEYPHSAYDRYSYLQGILWSVAIAVWLRKYWTEGTRGQLAGLAVTGVSLIFALLAWQQVPVWRDTITLYGHIVDRLGEHPNRSRFDEVLGVHYLRAGLTNEAAASFESAIFYESRRADRHLYSEGVLSRANLRLGDLRADQDRLEEARRYYEAALQANPRYPGLADKIRSCLDRLKKQPKATDLRSAGL